jgi:preprotein translocase subunit SecY
VAESSFDGKSRSTGEIDGFLLLSYFVLTVAGTFAFTFVW